MAGDIRGADRRFASVPVVFIDPHGTQTDDHIHGSPCVDITFVSMAPATPAGAAVKALIDTGVDYIYLDREILNYLEPPVIRNTIADGVLSTVHRMMISLPALGLQWPTEVYAHNIRAQGNGFDAILGRQLLQYGRLIYDVRNGYSSAFVIDLTTLECR